MLALSKNPWDDDAHDALMEIVEALAGFVAEASFVTREDRKTAQSIADRARRLRKKTLDIDDDRRRSG